MFIPFVIAGGLIGLFFGGAAGMLIGIFLGASLPFIVMTALFIWAMRHDRKHRNGRSD